MIARTAGTARTYQDMHEIANPVGSPPPSKCTRSRFRAQPRLTRLLLGILQSVDLQYSRIATSLAVVGYEEDIVAHAGLQTAHLKVRLPVMRVKSIFECPRQSHKKNEKR